MTKRINNIRSHTIPKYQADNIIIISFRQLFKTNQGSASATVIIIILNKQYSYITQCTLTIKRVQSFITNDTTTRHHYIIVLSCYNYTHQGSITTNVVLIDLLRTLKELSLIRWEHQKRHHDIINFVRILFLSICCWFRPIIITTSNNMTQGSNPCHHDVLSRLIIMFWIVCFNSIREALLLPTLLLSIQQYHCKNHNTKLTYSNRNFIQLYLYICWKDITVPGYKYGPPVSLQRL